MSIAALSWAKKQKTGSPTMKSVLVSVADYADERGIAWPSQKQLSLDTEMSTRSIMRALADLEELGFLKRKRRTRSDGTRASDIIYLNFERQISHCPNQGDTLSPDNLSCDKNDIAKVTHCPNQGDTLSPLIRDTTYPSYEPSKELPLEQSNIVHLKPPKKKNVRIPYHGDFEMLWAEYHEGGKKPAYEAWLKLPEEDRDRCFDGMRLYKADLDDYEKWSRLRRTPPIPLHLSTFINRRHFDDWLEKQELQA